ncbi:MAG: hypothetical protein GW913_08760 [Myxococcales bacterium]|nr:hypothetical protein [Myxococcales bacterium]
MPVVARGPRSAASSRADGYERRRPEETLLYRVVSGHWPELLERAEQAGGLPSFVTKELRGSLECGLLEHGFVQLVCKGCGEELLLACSCKRRGFCPSCVGRRMSDLAAHCVDEVFAKEVPMRQRAKLAALGRALCAGLRPRAVRGRAAGVHQHAEAVPSSTREARVRLALGERGSGGRGDSGVAQRQRVAARCARSHGLPREPFRRHTLAPDGVWVRDADGELRFRELPPPTAEHVAEVASRSYEKLLRVLARHGPGLRASTTPPTRSPTTRRCWRAATARRPLTSACSARTPASARPSSPVPCESRSSPRAPSPKWVESTCARCASRAGTELASSAYAVTARGPRWPWSA